MVVPNNATFDIEHYEFEAAFDLDDAKAVLAEYRACLRALPLAVSSSVIVDVRVTAADEAWLSSAFGRPSLWVDIVLPLRVRGDFDHLCDALAPIVRKWGGRPHWGKINPLGVEYTRACFPNLGEFEKLRMELDPQGMFRNEYLDQFFPEFVGAVNNHRSRIIST